MPGTHHSLNIWDRGSEHRHRWEADCECGWHCIPLRNKKSVEDRYRAHVTASRPADQRSKVKRKRGKHPVRSTAEIQPRAVTPHELLPEVLR